MANKKITVASITEPMEKAIFAARWILAPFYVGLILTLILLLIKFVQEFVKFVSIIWTADFKATELALLSMLDLALLGNLVLIIVFAGYENFVSKIESAEGSVDRPEWMGRVDFSGLKLKLIGSLVAISVIELLKDFMEADDGEVNDGLIWRIAIHMVFVISGLLFAVMDTIAARTDRMVNEAREERHLPTKKRG
ncbi:MAG: hypothetical protein RL540_1452 [Actinomycetota bacterium]|jgi:uncharacterized protein (TIGR00645 family)